MNTTKKHLTVLLLGMIIILPLFTTSCLKKGDEDPFVSMYTRKARVTGTWDITSMDSKIKRVYADDEQTLTTTLVTDLNWDQTIEIIGTDSVREYEGVVLEGRNTIIFDTDGRFTRVYEYEYEIDSSVNEGEIMITTTVKVLEELTGTWNFLHNIDDYKRKERIALVIEEQKTSVKTYILTTSDDDDGEPVQEIGPSRTESVRFANGEMSTVWILRMLKNKQIIMDQNINNFAVINTDGEGGDEYREIGFETQTLIRR